MLLKFIGRHTNGHTSISYGGVTFEGNEPAEVKDAALARRLSGNPEFEKIDALDHDADGEKGGAKADPAAPASADDITAALALLDPDDDAHWTNAGLPAVEAVAAITGKSVKRAEITDAAPDFTRTKKDD